MASRGNREGDCAARAGHPHCDCGGRSAGSVRRSCAQEGRLRVAPLLQEGAGVARPRPGGRCPASGRERITHIRVPVEES